MGTFLDLRSSENSNTTGLPGTSLSATPALFGVIGLQTRSVTNPIVTLTGVIGISNPTVGNTFTIQVLRGTTVFNPANVIFTLTQSVRVASFSDTYTFTAQDLLAPAAAETVYSAFVTGGPLIVTSGVRTGPEVFWGVASSTL
ncbi:hypothetical protein [Cohnella sp. REN36]|uniref:hypothetical protein n=1 Tax=Cohnella sp. REN36 TaxID=2887347 RepID=UPI001D153182|nr:hypothetical protein [Cohnella sp. REN36]MCC3377289.1 hypothetical protein [Cohnella sp. REN36]